MSSQQYPLLPGFAPTQQFKDNFRKVSHVKQQQNRQINNIQPTKYILPRQVPYQQPNAPQKTIISTSHDHFTSKIGYQTNKLFQPDWVRLDRQVLRFYGYFKQSVVQSNLQNARNRKVKIMLYLQDNSISMNQQKQQNSGIPQGKFLKRQKCLGPNGKYLTAFDFRIGQSINIYGKNIFLYNCDQYTRQFYQIQNAPQGPAQQYYQDQWSTKMNTKWVPQKDSQMKQYLQKKLGGGRVASQKQFLQNDRKVLKFFATSQDCKYIIHFFLADNTLQVRQIIPNNSGKDPFSVVFKRQPLPAKFALNQPGQTYAEQFLDEKSLIIGQYVHVFGKNYLLQSCDLFTQYYYKTKYGRDYPTPDNLPVQFTNTNNNNIIIPPHNGIGSQQDSLGYIYRLVPKPPKKDFFKWVDQQISLRFTAVFKTPKPQDAHRKFIITFYLNDDTIQIYQSSTRNSGFSEGKFLEKNQYKNVNGKIFQPQELVVGYDVKINGYMFHITDCDDFTKKWYAQNTIWEKVKQ